MILNRWVYWISLVLIAVSCKMSYSFSGASVPANVKTISIATFPVYAPLAPPTLSQTFTEALKDRFLRQTNLTMVRQNGDIQLEGKITEYTSKPEAVTASDIGALNRLTITVQVKFTDTKNEKNSFEQSFSNFKQYPADQNLTEVENQLITEIVDLLTQDIFSRSLGNW